MPEKETVRRLVTLCVSKSVGFFHISVFIKFRSSGLSYYFNLSLINDFSFSVKRCLKMSMEVDNVYYKVQLCPQVLEDTLVYVLKN